MREFHLEVMVQSIKELKGMVTEAAWGFKKLQLMREPQLKEVMVENIKEAAWAYEKFQLMREPQVKEGVTKAWASQHLQCTQFYGIYYSSTS